MSRYGQASVGCAAALDEGKKVRLTQLMSASGRPPQVVGHLVDDINEARREIYEIVAELTGSTPELVAAEAATR